MSSRFILNEFSYFGRGSRADLVPEIQKRGFKKVFVVTDDALVKCGVAAKVTELLDAANIKYVVYSDVKPNPTIANVMTGLAASDKQIDVVFMDPPRSGSSTEFIDAIHTLLPKKVVYISCGPDSLKRDLEYFKKKGKYKVVSMSPFDMFCHTSHCEMVVLMSKKDK